LYSRELQPAHYAFPVPALQSIILIMRSVREMAPQPDRQRLFRYALWITVLGNILLASSKGFVASITGSAAIYADAANSISDVIYSLTMVVGLWISMQPPDQSHPQGHSRFEPLVGMVVTISMGLAGYEALRTGIQRGLSGGSEIELGLPMIILLISALMKTAMFFSIRKIASRVASPALNTTAKDNLSDVLASSAAFVGVLASSYIHPLADPVAGVLVSIWIFKAAFEAGKENLKYLTGAGASPELREQIIDTASAVAGVIKVHQTMTEYVGPTLVIDMHINVDGSLTLDEAHTISDNVISELEEFSEVDRAYVHLEPEGWI
jgi:cation diffusion facilitator family transporter